MTLEFLLGARFRANPDYELVLFDRLPPLYKEMFRDLQRDPEFYGVLLPGWQSGLGAKAMTREAALLFLTLQQPGPLPSYFHRLYGSEGDRVVAELVLDSVLQVHHGGAFVSGAQTYSLLQPPAAEMLGTGALAQLSYAALRYGQSLAIDDISRLSARIYFYNRLPLAPELRRSYPTTRAVANHLRIHSGSVSRHVLDANWIAAAGGPNDGIWLLWRNRNGSATDLQGKAVFKLYVSPCFRALGDVMPCVIDVLTRRKTASFKVGADLAGLLRPDKLVAYFDSFEELKGIAGELTSKLAGVPAHGVPFTAELNDSGLLSWGVDPPRDQQALSWQERESWRLWITNRLAAALLVARSAPDVIEPWLFALQRLRWEGIDTKTWIPESKFWSRQERLSAS